MGLSFALVIKCSLYIRIITRQKDIVLYKMAIFSKQKQPERSHTTTALWLKKGLLHFLVPLTMRK